MKTYGCVYLPLRVMPKEDKHRPDRTVAFIGRQLCFFENDAPRPRTGIRVEVMITKGMFSTYPDDHPRAGAVNYHDLRALILQPVDPKKHMLIAIDGFECSGTMCRTTAHGKETDGSRVLTSNDVYPPGEKLSQAMWLTPGRCGIFEASNINVSSNDPNRVPLRPTNVWVDREDYERRSGCGVRVIGLTRPSDGQWFHLIRQ